MQEDDPETWLRNLLDSVDAGESLGVCEEISDLKRKNEELREELECVYTNMNDAICFGYRGDDPKDEKWCPPNDPCTQCWWDKDSRALIDLRAQLARCARCNDELLPHDRKLLGDDTRLCTNCDDDSAKLRARLATVTQERDDARAQRDGYGAERNKWENAYNRAAELREATEREWDGWKNRAEYARARTEELESAIRWVLGEGDSDFPGEMPPGTKVGKYYWRKELQRRAALRARDGR